MKLTVILAVVVIIVIGGGTFVFFVYVPEKEEAERTHASESGRIKATITVAGDNYLGYWLLKSEEFLRRLRSRGYAVNFVDDGADYEERHQKFAKGEYDFMVLPIATYIENGGVPKGSSNYLGRIPAGLSVSVGADSVLADKNKLTGGENREATVNDLNNPDLRICFTPNSPSHTELNWLIANFNLWHLKTLGPWAIFTDGSQDAYERLERGECDVAIVWEPNVSMGLELPGIVSIFGSDEIEGMIVDVFNGQKHIYDDHEKVDAFFLSYFETVHYYDSHRDEMIEEMLKNSDLKTKEAVEKAIERIEWLDLHDNCGTWFDMEPQGATQTFVKNEKIIDSIVESSKVMVKLGQFPSDPLNNNPYSIVNFDVLRRLCNQADSLRANIGIDLGEKTFDPLPDEEWANLPVKGNLDIPPITFNLGTNKITRDSKEVLEDVAIALKINSRDRLLIRGHTAPSRSGSAEDELANMEQSQQRADVVKHNLKTFSGIDENRMRAVGVGGTEPLEQLVFYNDQGEKIIEPRSSWLGRLPRVEFVLLRDK